MIDRVSYVIGNSFLPVSALDGRPMLRDGSTGDWIGTFDGHKGAVWSARFDQTIQKVCTASADFTARVWDRYTGTELIKLDHPHVVKSVHFHQVCFNLFSIGVFYLATRHVRKNMETNSLFFRSRMEHTCSLVEWIEHCASTI